MIEQIKQMRAIHDFAIVDCKKALEATGGDVKQAVEWMRQEYYRRLRAAHPRGASVEVGF